jgi:cell division septal protein FtsQ
VEVDLKVESPKIREMAKAEQKRRGFKWAAAIILLICMAALLKVTVREAFLKNPRFMLRQVVVRTEGPATARQIVSTSALTHGMNLLTLNLREVQARIQGMPQVRSVKISRDYHGRLTLEVAQRQPVAWLECAGLGMRAGSAETGHFLDAEGTVFPCEVVTESYAKLPIIRHSTLARSRPGQQVADPQVRAALALLSRLQERQMVPELPAILEIETHSTWGLNVAFQDGTHVLFGIDDQEEQLARLNRVWIEARHRQWKIDTLNVIVRENIPITFREAPDLRGLQDPLTAATPSAHKRPPTR